MSDDSAAPRDTDDDPERPRPDLHKLVDAVRARPFDIRSFTLTAILVLAVCFAAYVARALLLPIVVAILLNFLFAPAVRGLRRRGLPAPVGAALVLLGVIGWSALALMLLAEPLGNSVSESPVSLADLDHRLAPLLGPVTDVQGAMQSLEGLMSGARDDGTVTVELKRNGLLSTVFAGTLDVLVTWLSTIILLYFLLSSGDLFLEKLVAVLPRFQDKKRAVATYRQVETEISRYLVTITIINAALGLAMSLAMHMLGVPHAWLIGVMAALLNFVPFVGAIVGAAVVSLLAMAAGLPTVEVLMAPTAYLMVNGIEGYLITPTVLGRSLSLNPVAVFLAILYWGWMWGVAGLLIAVPMLAVIKIMCDRSPSFAAIGEFLGR